MNNLIAGLDPSSKQLGIAILDKDTGALVYRDVIIANPKNLIMDRLREIIIELYHRRSIFLGVGLVVIERPASKLNFKTLHALSMLDGAILTILWLFNPMVSIEFVAASTAKKRATGSGRATKEEVIGAINKRLGIVETNNNITDAVAVALTGCNDE